MHTLSSYAKYFCCAVVGCWSFACSDVWERLMWRMVPTQGEKYQKAEIFAVNLGPRTDSPKDLRVHRMVCAIILLCYLGKLENGFDEERMETACPRAHLSWWPHKAIQCTKLHKRRRTLHTSIRETRNKYSGGANKSLGHARGKRNMQPAKMKTKKNRDYRVS